MALHRREHGGTVACSIDGRVVNAAVEQQSDNVGKPLWWGRVRVRVGLGLTLRLVGVKVTCRTSTLLLYLVCREHERRVPVLRGGSAAHGPCLQQQRADAQQPPISRYVQRAVAPVIDSVDGGATTEQVGHCLRPFLVGQSNWQSKGA